MVGAKTPTAFARGTLVRTGNVSLFWGVIASMWLGNLMLVVIILTLFGAWVRLLKMPYRLLYPTIVIPIIILKLQGESLEFTQRGATFASIAGALGAFGAIFIAAALKSGGQPLYVMPLVFGGAPLVNIVVSSLLHPPKEAPSPLLYVGFVIILALAF